TLSLLALAGCGSSTRRTASLHPLHASGAPAAPAAPAISPAGLPLGHAPFALQGISEAPAANIVHVAFRHPPRAGLLVDMHSGRVLWQLHPLARLAIASLTKMMTALIAVKAAAPNAQVLVHRDDVEAP